MFQSSKGARGATYTPSLGAYRTIWLRHCWSFTAVGVLPPPCIDIYRLRPSAGFAPNTLYIIGMRSESSVNTFERHIAP